MMRGMTRSSFECQHKAEGLHPDVSSGCQVGASTTARSQVTVGVQVFYMCHENGRSGRFTCPVGTLFSQQLGVCDWAKKVNCKPSRP